MCSGFVVGDFLELRRFMNEKVTNEAIPRQPAIDFSLILLGNRRAAFEL